MSVEAARRNPIILIVDDDPHNLAVITEYLGDTPYTLLVAEDGYSGLKRADYVRPDLILLDVMMPGLNGFETCRRLKAQESTKEVPVIFMTALAETEHKVRGFEAGAVDYLTKPVQREEVLARVGVHLRLRELTARLQEANETLEKRVEERTAAFRNAERRLAEILDFLPDPTFAVDLEGRITFWNRAAEEFTGVPAEAMLGKGEQEYAVPFYAKRRPVLVDLVLHPSAELTGYYPLLKTEGGAVVGECYTRSCRGEAYVMAIAAPLRDGAGNMVGAIESIRDITARKRGEEEHLRLAAALEQAAEGIIVAGTDWSIQYVNPAFERMNGYRLAEVLGHHSWLLRATRQDERIFEEMKETVLAGRVWSGQLTNRRKDGSCYRAEVTVSPVRDREGNLINLVGVHRDITHELRLERQLRQAQKMEALGTLAAGIAHDFNNILTAVLGFTDLALMKLPPDTPGRRDVERVMESSGRAADLVRQILTFTRSGELERRPEHLAGIVDEVLKLLRSSFPTTVEIQRSNRVGEDEDVVLADATQIHQVLMNLGTNAAHAMRERGGVLGVDLMRISVDPSMVERYPELHPGPYLRLTVSDTGHGIDPVIMDRIFDPYFTTKKVGEGTGMGLAVVQGIVKSHGGSLTVMSEPGQGAVFQLFLPVHTDPVLPAELPPERAAGGAERILFVDDETFLTDLGVAMLGALGYRVTAKNNSRDALEIFRLDPDAFDLVVTDLTMPGLTGLGLAAEIRSLRSGLPIVLCTGFSEWTSEEEPRRHGIREVIQKPYVIDTLAAAVRRALS